MVKDGTVQDNMVKITCKTKILWASAHTFKV